MLSHMDLGYFITILDEGTPPNVSWGIFQSRYVIVRMFVDGNEYVACRSTLVS